MNRASFILLPGGLPFENRERRTLRWKSHTLKHHRQYVPSQDFEGSKLPDVVLVVSNGEMILELMESQFHRLALIVQKLLDTVPS
jgi:hypothetical protein